MDKIQKLYLKEQIESMIQGCRSDVTYETWKEIRYFITDAIDKAGTFLDIGCANGFFVKCLQTWSKFNVIPYGIDNRKEAIEEAQSNFPELKDHFKTITGDHLSSLSQTNFPQQFDYVYRSYWKSEPKDKIILQKILKELMTCVKPGGRLILGVYFGLGPVEEGLQTLEERSKKFQNFINTFKRSIESINGESFSKHLHWVCWIDKVKK